MSVSLLDGWVAREPGAPLLFGPLTSPSRAAVALADLVSLLTGV
jgi:hypothetical protein